MMGPSIGRGDGPRRGSIGRGGGSVAEGGVGAIYEQFERELAALRRRDAGRPRREMVRLLLLALEREEIVAVGYREALIARRLGAMPIGPRTRALIRHALTWA